jgi:hypothetical protein
MLSRHPSSEPEAIMNAHSRPALTLVALAAAGLAVAAAYEAPETFTASQVLKPAQVKGPHFSVKPAVTADGYFFVFDLTTDYGALEAEGKSTLLKRIYEVGALAKLDEVSKSQVFLAAAGNSVLNVGKGVAAAVKDPGATAKGMGDGIKRFGTNIGRKAKRTTDKAVDSVQGDDKPKDGSGKSTTDAAADAAGGIAKSALGVSKGSRRWAQKLAVDPYTTNPILQKALQDIGMIDAAGGIAAKIVVPIPMVVSTTATVGNLVWGKDPEELRKYNEQQLAQLGVSGAVIKQLYLSKGFTLSLQTRFVAALAAAKVKGAASYVETAAEAASEREADFFVESAEMLQRLHAKTPVAEVLTDSRALVAKTGDGAAVVLLPVDRVRWTEAFDKASAEVAERAKKELGATKLAIQMTGTMSATAKKELAARGWTVTENVPSSVELLQPKAAAAKK